MLWLQTPFPPGRHISGTAVCASQHVCTNRCPLTLAPAVQREVGVSQVARGAAHRAGSIHLKRAPAQTRGDAGAVRVGRSPLVGPQCSWGSQRGRSGMLANAAAPAGRFAHMTMHCQPLAAPPAPRPHYPPHLKKAGASALGLLTTAGASSMRRRAAETRASPERPEA